MEELKPDFMSYTMNTRYKIIDWVILILTFVFKPVILWSMIGIFLGGIFMGDDIARRKCYNDLDQDVTLLFVDMMNTPDLDTSIVYKKYHYMSPIDIRYYPIHLKRKEYTAFFENQDMPGGYIMKYKDVYYLYYPKQYKKLSLSIEDGSKYINDIQAAKKYYPRFLIPEILVVIALALYGYWRKVTLRGNKLYFISLGIWVFFLVSNALHVFFLFRYL